jgi:hypothetical protein
MQATIVYFLPEGRNRNISKWGVGGLAAAGLTSGITNMFFSGIPIPKMPTGPFDKIPSGINMGRTSLTAVLTGQLLKSQRSSVGIVAGVWLISWPTIVITRMKLRRRVKTILVASFGSAAILLAIEIFHCVNLVRQDPLTSVSGRLAVSSSRTFLILNRALTVTRSFSCRC